MNNLKYNGTVTGRMQSIPSIQNLPKNVPQPALQIDPVDIDYLNSAWHPTHYARVQRRREALDRYLYLASIGMKQALDELADVRARGQFNLGLVERYKAMYQFTQEEINARNNETDRYIQGAT
jgi:hypothetical protein